MFMLTLVANFIFHVHHGCLCLKRAPYAHVHVDLCCVILMQGNSFDIGGTDYWHSLHSKGEFKITLTCNCVPGHDTVQVWVCFTVAFL